MLLSDVLNNYAKSISFHIQLNTLNDEFCERLQKLAKQNKGKVQLAVHVDDVDNNISLFMKSPQLLIEPRNFVKLLEKMPEVSEIKFNGR